MRLMPERPIDQPPHTLPPAAVVAHFGTDPVRGLTRSEAVRRLTIAGPNELPTCSTGTNVADASGPGQEVLIMILLVAIGLSLVLGHAVEAVAIAVITLFSVVLGFIQERRAERALEALRRMSAPHATVRRVGTINALLSTVTPGSGIFSRPVVVLILLGGCWSALVNVALFTWALASRVDVREAMTMTFVSLVLIQFCKAYSFRSERHAVFQGTFENRWLNWAVLWELALLGLIIYLPILQAPFGTFPLPLVDWLIMVGAALTIVPVLETAKWMERRGWFGPLE